MVVGAVAPPSPSSLYASMVPQTEAQCCLTACQALALTWQSQQGEVAPALGEARALPDAGAPQPLVVEYSCHRVVVQILGAPLVHAGGGNDACNPSQ